MSKEPEFTVVLELTEAEARWLRTCIPFQHGQYSQPIWDALQSVVPAETDPKHGFSVGTL